MIDYQVFRQFGEAVTQLGQTARKVELDDGERVRRAKAVMLSKIDRQMGVDLESCVKCGYCSEACHFYVQTQEPKYVPTRKLDLLRRVYDRERSPLHFVNRLFEREITADELRDWQELVYDSCTECGRCSYACPMGINIARGVNVMREALPRPAWCPTSCSPWSRSRKAAAASLASAQRKFGLPWRSCAKAGSTCRSTSRRPRSWSSPRSSTSCSSRTPSPRP